jgi:putative endonuclease
MTRGRQALGAYGEALAAKWYEARGFEVVDRNWRTRTGELDLVVVSETFVVFCEVKSRSGQAYGSALESLRASQIARIRRTAVEWLAAKGGSRGRAVRFDLAAVEDGRLLGVVEGAF